MLLRTLIAHLKVDEEAHSASERATADKIVSSLEDVGALFATVDSVDDLHRRIDEEPFDLLILDRDLAGQETAGLVRAFRARSDAPEVIVMIAEDDAALRAELVASGAYSVLPDALPANLLRDALTAIAERRLVETRAQLQAIPDEDYSLGDYVTQSAPMKRVLASAERVAALDTTLLILGETGVGKGLLARSIHNESPRARGPFISMNCGALTESLLEAELFGHERGAFTGADRARRGYFELAHKGTLFLDEIAEMPLHLQSRLLQVIEDRRVRPVGSEKRVDVDIRLIVATNRDLPLEVKEKRFREDLYYRLNVVTVTLPPLRERTEDLPEIAQSYVEHFRALIASPARQFSDGALDAILRYPWPGNVRELANAIERAIIMASGPEIQIEDLAVDIQSMAGASTSQPGRASGPIEMTSNWLEQPWTKVRREVLEEAEIRYLRALLEATGGKVGETAERAGMDPRSLHQKMKKYGLRKEDYRD